ncbi:hybrid sensor histidine kinase/response regulator [Neorhodopirellula lusitana]|uniref:hybrid sensor histidine kinase/response regulator n=1 Tax=Neorhodopirellula lusitana TaxID=445327 RepID=UPI00384C0945
MVEPSNDAFTGIRPRHWWIAATLALMVADMAAPTWWGLCVLHLVMLPLIWRFVHRRFITKITIVQVSAVLVAGGWHVVSQPFGVNPLDPVRVWTFWALLAAGYFHIYLRRRLRMRLEHQHYLQQNVRRRSREIERVNHALRDEVARRQATQHRLDQSETTFQSIMDRMHLQVARKNATGVFTYANDPFCKELGLHPIDVIGSTDADLYAPATAALYRADDLSVIATGRNVDKVEEHPGSDGRPGFVQVFKAPEYDQHGRCIGVQVIFWDITEKHRNEISLRHSEARKRALFDAAGDAVLLVDEAGIIMEANPAAMGMLQSGGGRLLGRPMDNLVMPVRRNLHPETSSWSEADVTSASLGEGEDLSWHSLPLSDRHQLQLRRGDGVTFDSEVSVHIIPLGNPSPTATFEDEEREGRAIIIRDVTLQQQAFEAMRDAKAAAEQANRTKTQFMAGISHELRTPLGGIGGLTELLSRQTLPGPARRYVNLIAQNAELLHDAIEDILDFSAIEAGRVAIDPVPIDLHSIVGDAFGCLAIRAADKPVRLSFSIAPFTPRWVVADAKRIRQVIVNLAGNAIKFTAAGQVSLRMTVEPTGGQAGNPGHALFQLVIEDTGIGIAPENQGRIFDAFEQADRGTNKRFGGTGLGLAIARGLAQRMGGGITLESEVGKGSRFIVKFDLPLVQDVSDKPTHSIEACPEAQASPIVVSVGNVTIESDLAETIVDQKCAVYKPSDLEGEQPKSAVWWILTDATADAAFRIRARKSEDRVLWLTRASEAAPRRAKKEDAVIIEPVHPHELRRWLAGQALQQSVRGLRSARGSRAVPGASKPLTSAGVVRTGNAAPSLRHDSASSLIAPRSTAPVTRRNGSGALSEADQSQSQYRVLVVDDSPTNRLVIHDQLVSAGHHVCVAEGGETALSYFPDDESAVPASTFDCILMDLQMPTMDGTEVTTEIRRRAAHFNRAMPPVIALTAHVTDQHRQMCRDAGMVGYITKPIELELLLHEMQRVVTADRSGRPVSSKISDDSLDAEPKNEAGELNSDVPSDPGPSETFEAESGVEPQPVAGPDLKPEALNEATSAAKPENADSDDWKTRLTKLCGGDESTMKSVCEAIVIEVPDLVRRLERAGKSGDQKALKTAAHTLKSCLRYVAPEDEINLAREVEAKTDDADWVQRIQSGWLAQGDAVSDEVQQLRNLQELAREWVKRIRS